MGSLSLGRPKWGGSTWAKGAQEGRAPRGASRKLPPSPLAQPLGLPPPPRWLPSPSPINRGGGGTPSCTTEIVLFPEGLPPLSPSH